jgi:hypothetical protein
MRQIEIIHGPNKDGLMTAFFERKSVNVRLANGRDQQFIINCLKHEDGSGNSFIFKTMRGVRGYYNTRNKRGYINPPLAH